MSKKIIFVIFGLSLLFSTAAFSLSIEQKPPPKPPPVAKLPDVNPQAGPYKSPRTSDFKISTRGFSCGELKNRLNSHNAAGQSYQAMLAERVFHSELTQDAQRQLQLIADLISSASSNSTLKNSLQNEVSCLQEVADKSQSGFMQASLLAVEMLNKVLTQSQPEPFVDTMPKIVDDTPKQVLVKPKPVNWCGTKSDTSTRLVPSETDATIKRIPANTSEKAVAVRTSN